MRRRGVQCLVRSGILALCTLLWNHTLSHAQDEEIEPGHSIGKVSTDGNLVVMELDDGALGKANLFDLVGKTLGPVTTIRSPGRIVRSTPARAGWGRPG